MSNPYNNPYVLFFLDRIRDMGTIMEAMEVEAGDMEVDRMVAEGDIIMIHTNQAIKDMEDIIRDIENRETKMRQIVVHVWVPLVVLAVCCLCVCVDVHELILAASLIVKFIKI